MHIQRVVLQNFRNISMVDVELTPGINVLYGENAQGKTNFLESIYFCATGRSHRSARDKDLVKTSEKEASARVFVASRHTVDEIKMQIGREGKSAAVNQLPIGKLGELYGHLTCVIFSPEDLALVKAGPQVRRRFVDMELCQLYPAYYHNLRMYYKVLKQRNNLLKDLFKNKKLLDTLILWDEQLVEYGVKIMAARERFVAQISSIAGKNQQNITGGRENLEIIYRNNVNIDSFFDKLAKYRETDIQRGATSVGIHKDDIEFRINNDDTRVFGSQGQQRTVALAVKLAEIELVRMEKGYSPVLLLDDVLSELDKNRQNYLLGSVDGLQAIITLTGAENAVGGYLRREDARIFGVENGTFTLQL
ncbi:MAG: DNA replication/repair protein RecF [Defluviitaleaceae bacterium]|nr:DNA replication/repair protein RecF [Defluviitaleaceae bacterium]